MRIVRVLFRLTTGPGRRPPPAGAPESVSPLLQDLLWAHTVPGDGVDHIRVRPFAAGAESTEAAIFVRTDADSVAQDRVRALLARARAPITARGCTAEIPES